MRGAPRNHDLEDPCVFLWPSGTLVIHEVGKRLVSMACIPHMSYQDI